MKKKQAGYEASHLKILTQDSFLFLSLSFVLILTDSLRFLSSVLMHPTEKYLP